MSNDTAQELHVLKLLWQWITPVEQTLLRQVLEQLGQGQMPSSQHMGVLHETYLRVKDIGFYVPEQKQPESQPPWMQQLAAEHARKDARGALPPAPPDPIRDATLPPTVHQRPTSEPQAGENPFDLFKS